MNTPPNNWRGLILRLVRPVIRSLETLANRLEDPAELPIERVYRQGLTGLRSFLPASVNQQLPDWGLAGAIAALVLVLFWAGTNLLNPQPVAVAPSPVVAPAPPTLEAPPVAEVPIPEVSPPPPEVPPEPPVNPEEALVATIERQIRTAGGDQELVRQVINKIDFNLGTGYLRVVVNPQWYALSERQQDRFAKGIGERSQQLEVSRLEIVDQAGQVVARPAVVGSGMIILRRQIGFTLPS